MCSRHSVGGGLRSAQGRRGFLRSPLQASCRVRHFPDEFQGGWSGKQVPYRHGGFRPGQRSCGEPEFPSDLSPVSLFYEGLDECSTLSDKLMYALKNMNNWNRMPDALKEQVFSHLDRLAAKAHLSEGDRIAYDKAVDRYNVSRIVENDIREQAIAEGKAIGEAEGRAEGRLEGRLEIARKLKDSGFSIADIARIAELSPEEIDKL